MKEDYDMKNSNSRKGFSLVELMITIAIIALLVALAIPSYSQYVRKGKRGDAEQLLMNWANLQEIWRANNPTYATSGNIAVPTHADYTFFVRETGTACANTAPTSASYALVACPQGDQANDKDKGQDCDPLSLDQSGGKGPQVLGVTYCWGD